MISQKIHIQLSLLVALSLPLCIQTNVNAHEGRTNASGCHTNRSTGDYHCHTINSSSSNSPNNITNQPTIQKINEATCDIDDSNNLLMTSSFCLYINSLCPEGNVVCDQVRLQIIDRETRETYQLIGETKHSMGHDGVPSAFRGYQFPAGEYSLFIDTSNTLQIFENQTLILEEQGEWVR